MCNKRFFLSTNIQLLWKYLKVHGYTFIVFATIYNWVNIITSSHKQFYYCGVSATLSQTHNDLLFFQTGGRRLWMDQNPDFAGAECRPLQWLDSGEHRQELSLKTDLPGPWEQRHSWSDLPRRENENFKDFFLGFEDSYIRKIYQIFTSQHFTNDDLIHNQLTVTISVRYWQLC